MDPQRRERVIVGIDGSPLSLHALAWALRYAERTGAAVEALYAWQIPLSYEVPLEVREGESFTDTAERALDKSVDEALVGHGDLQVERTATLGYPPKVLVERSRDAELLVVGSRGRVAIAGALLGSTSLHCVTHAHCPVVVVHNRPAPAEEPSPI